MHVPYSAVRNVQLVVPVSRPGLGAFRLLLLVRQMFSSK